MTLPLLSSRVSAAATPTKNNAAKAAAKKRFTLRITPLSHRRFTIARHPTSPQRNASLFYCIGCSDAAQGLRDPCIVPRRKETHSRGHLVFRFLSRGALGREVEALERKGPSKKLEPFSALHFYREFVVTSFFALALSAN